MLAFPAGLNESEFVKAYWQKRPLVLSQGLPQAVAVIDKQTLLDLSFSEDVESRLITEFDETYELYDGPQLPEQLTALETKSHWTVLVQSVNLWHRQVAALLNHFQFIPQWRFDDIMISYASDQGGVGPHTDEYDVFLIQIAGQRRWRVGEQGMAVTPQDAECGLKQVAPFQASIDRVFEPGDVLYIPPATPHEGISLGEGLTLSVGFRSPSLAEFSMMLGEELQPGGSHYRDPQENVTDSRYKISHTALTQVEDWFKKGLESATLHRAFAKLQTQPKQELLLEPVTEPIEWLSSGHSLCKDPAARIAWIEENDDILVFANGEEIRLSADAKNIVELICPLDEIDLPSISAYIDQESTTELIEFLTDMGYLGVNEDQHD